MLGATNISGPCASALYDDITVKAMHEVIEHRRNNGEAVGAALRYQATDERQCRRGAGSEVDRPRGDGTDHCAIYERIEAQRAQRNPNLGRVRNGRLEGEMDAASWVIRRQIE